ncbi:NSFL1 cofactor p47 [Toxorhynchites rutilus septentrionalis]|uniref:NSFL1 cofactor p47 n=1 Tax=Toxorhynchites rutilus septentrionalis TaxID=329112 RepID=UPI00247A2856|nr:NSFL1 cofactor p47 [Toxorhynchites rutilus septentrionalis]
MFCHSTIKFCSIIIVSANNSNREEFLLEYHSEKLLLLTIWNNMSNNEEQIKKFADVTGVSEDRAKFYLDAANGELQVALSSFYEADNEDNPTDGAAAPMDDDSDDDNMPTEMVQFSSSSKRPRAKKTTKSNFATLSSLNDSSSEDEEEQGQAFYAGGSERSGQQVLGPPKKNPIKDYVSEIFRSAQQGQMETVDPDTSSSSSSSLYGGTGYKLGQTENDHQAVPGRSRNSSGHNHEVVTLTLWRQGFSINDGELRRYEDAANKAFFESIMRGEIPAELRSKGPAMIHLDLKDNRHEDYSARSTPFKPFGGSGQTLGSPVPNVVESGSTSATPTNNEDNEKKAVSELAVDESQPTTTLQIRLADGSRLSARFNQNHTVDNIRQYVIRARPNYASLGFALLTTFPSKELADGSQTLKEAGLLNAAIMQRLK